MITRLVAEARQEEREWWQKKARLLAEWTKAPCLSQDSAVYRRAMRDVLAKLRELGLLPK
jgi:hypothetical protein